MELSSLLKNLLIVTIASGVGFVVSEHQTNSHKRSIINYLNRLEATNISIEFKHLDKSNYKYFVEYTNAQGVSCQTYCMIGVGSARDGVIYWKETPR